MSVGFLPLTQPHPKLNTNLGESCLLNQLLELPDTPEAASGDRRNPDTAGVGSGDLQLLYLICACTHPLLLRSTK